MACTWLVNEPEKSEQTVNHEFLAKNFEILEISKERSLYGSNPLPFGAIT